MRWPTGADGGDVFRIEGCDVRQVPPAPVEVETIPDHEQVGNVETDEIGLDPHLGSPPLAQQDERSDPVGAAAAQFAEQGLERAAAVEDVVHHEHLVPGQVGQLVEMQFEPAGCRGRAPIAACPDHAQPDRPLEPADQVGDDHDAAGEHRDDGQRPPAAGIAHRGREPVDAGADLRGGEQDVHRVASGTELHRSLAGYTDVVNAHPRAPHWSTIAVGGHACELFSPPDPAPGRALIYLHDLQGRGLRETPGLCGLLEAARLPVIAPQTGRCWWIDRVVPGFDSTTTPERFVVDAVRDAIAGRFGVQPPGIAILGTGMGGQGALRLAYRHPALFPVVAAVAPAIDFHRAMREAADRVDGALFDTLWQVYGDVERARQDTAILHVHPLNWPRHQFFASGPDDVHWHDGAARLREKLVALGIPHVALLDPRAGSDAPATHAAAAAEALAFVQAALDQESRRLPHAPRPGGG